MLYSRLAAEKGGEIDYVGSYGVIKEMSVSKLKKRPSALILPQPRSKRFYY